MCAHFSRVIMAIYEARAALTAVRHVCTIYRIPCASECLSVKMSQSPM